MNVILASSSPYRRQQLEQIGLSFQAVPAKLDEEQLKNSLLLPTDLCQHLARAKAESLKEDYPQDIIIGCDQLVSFQGKALGKAGTAQKAHEQLKKLAGQTHNLVTCFYMTYKEEHLAHTNITQLTMRPLSDEEIAAYLKQDEPYDCAGSYKLEKAGISLFESIQSEDHSAIIGIPLIALTNGLLKLGHPLPFCSSSKEIKHGLK